MTRVSENSQTHALQFSLNKAKRKLEDLQLKGSTMRKLNRLSDNPIGNIEALTLKSASADNKQYIRNIQYAQMNLNIVEQSITQLTDLMSKAKELSIQQSSDFYEASIRKGVANEVKQLRNHALAIANKRLGQKFLFSGYKSLEQPFDRDGNYHGDKGQVTVEVSKDFFVPVNVSGDEIFYIVRDTKDSKGHPLNRFPELNSSPNHEIKKGEKINVDPVDQDATSRELASVEDLAKTEKRENIFSVLDTLHSALNNNDTDVIQDLLPKIDTIMSRLVRLRARIGSISNSIERAKDNLDVENINMEERNSIIADADVAELFGDIQKHQGILQATYKSGQSAINLSLLDFMR
jgi:flagellar hook-associated protein 3 FlgL